MKSLYKVVSTEDYTNFCCGVMTLTEIINKFHFNWVGMPLREVVREIEALKPGEFFTGDYDFYIRVCVERVLD